MIVLNNISLKQGDSIGFGYNVEIPAGLEHNQETYGIFTVYYTKAISDLAINDTIVGKSVKLASSEESMITAGIRKMIAENDDMAPMYEESSEAGIAGISTGEGPNLNLALTARVETQELQNNGTVEESELVAYTVNVRNDSDVIARNVTVTADVPNRTIAMNSQGKYDQSIKTVSLKIDEINPGETKQVAFALKLPIYEDPYEVGEGEGKQTIDTTRIAVNAKAKVEGYNDEFTSNEFVCKIVSASGSPKIKMLISTNIGEDLNKDTQITYSCAVSKNIQTDLTNARFEFIIPDGMEFVKCDEKGNVSSDKTKVNWRYEVLNSVATLTVTCKAKELPAGVYEKTVNAKFTAECNEVNTKFTSTEDTRKIVGSGVSISQTSDISDAYLDADDKITYIINVANKANASASTVLRDKLPSELKFVRYYFTQGGKLTNVTENAGNIVEIPLTLDKNETLTVCVEAQAKKLRVDKEVTNEVTATTAGVTESAEPLKHTILAIEGSPVDPDNPEGPDNPDNPGEVKKYRVSGTAWLDENRDGKRDTSEKVLANIKVYLLNATNNGLVAETVTSQSGGYTFLNVPAGRYIVAFEYDTMSYDITKYQADGVDVSFNSDAINMNITLKGETKKLAATNALVVNEHTYNVDLGLVDNPKFDMKLDKMVSLVQVSNAKGVSTHRFDDVYMAKVEIPEKQMAGSVVAITYKFKITNEGAVSGYVNRVVDYKAKDLAFSSTMNPEWYQDTNGNIYNTTLAGKEIKPGETVELSLILTKTMTTENVGVTNNTAELAEVSNDLGLADIDSTPGNKNTKEDDFGKADVVIAVKTGGIIVIIGIVIGVLAVFAFGAYEIKKRVLDRV